MSGCSKSQEGNNETFAKTENKTPTEIEINTSSTEYKDGEGADGMTSEFITKPTIIGNEYKVTNKMITEVLVDNKETILSYVETEAKRRLIEYDENSVFAYIKGISKISIGNKVTVNLGYREIPITMNGNVIGIVSIINDDNYFSWDWKKAENEGNNMYEEALKENGSSGILVIYNSVCDMIITDNNRIYSNTDISDIVFNDDIDYFHELYSDDCVMSSGMFKSSDDSVSLKSLKGF